MRILLYTLFLLLPALYPETGTAQQPVLKKRASHIVRGPAKSTIPHTTPLLPEQTPWMRIIYRELDLLHPQNSALYEQLFTCLYLPLKEKKLTAYEYIDGKELFDSAHCVTIPEMQTRFHLTDNEIPAANIRYFYLKEAWYLNPGSSTIEVKLLALCPLLTLPNDTGTGTNFRSPLCWIPYEQATPYLSATKIMPSDENNTPLFTLNDIFYCRMFRADIVKTGNRRNHSLKEQYSTPEAMKEEQIRIERELTLLHNKF